MCGQNSQNQKIQHGDGIVKSSFIVLCLLLCCGTFCAPTAIAARATVQMQQCENPSDVRVLVIMNLSDSFGNTSAGYRTQAACYDLKNHITQWLCDIDDQHCALITECHNAIRIKHTYGIDINAQTPKVFSGKIGDQLLDPEKNPNKSAVSLYLLSAYSKTKGKGLAGSISQCPLHSH